jgi:hypothetical protein
MVEQRNTSGDTSALVYIEESENRVRIMNKYDMRPLFAGSVFRSLGMRLNAAKG